MGSSRGESDRKNFEQSLVLMEIDGKTLATARFPFAIEPGWNRRNLRLTVFDLDKRTGVVHETADLPWQSTPTAPTLSASTAKAAPRAR